MNNDKTACSSQESPHEITDPALVSSQGHQEVRHHGSFWVLALGAIGVVFGDIGTSPLYAFREALLAASEGHPITEGIVLGILSMMIWTLILVVTLKYSILLLRADNNGEGGTLALLSLAKKGAPHLAPFLGVLGIVGASLFYGDAMITPAISVLSAVEGLKLVTPFFNDSIIPLTVGILVVLFAFQHHGTGRVASWFGPICLIWFAAIALLGIPPILENYTVFRAFNPYYGVAFAATHGIIALITLGAVFLTVTGAEAFYADLGHFGRKPIQVSWFFLVFPCLLLNYLGQGALVLQKPETLENPFFKLAPSWALLPLVVLATAATVIASQAVITGAYSLSQQASQLGLLPRLEVRHTSEALSGQIYIPQVNTFLLIGVLLLVFLFKTSSNLAVAYGIAVTGTMVITAILAFCVIHWVWRWRLWVSVLVMLPLLALDLIFLIANCLKVLHGGWVTLAVGLVVLVMIFTWQRGSRILIEKTRRIEVPLIDLVRQLEKRPPHQVAGTAVFLTSDPDFAPTALLHSLKHYKVLHEKNVILTIITEGVPFVKEERRVSFEQISPTFMRITLRFGFMQQPNVPQALSLCRKQGWKFDIMSTSFFLSRRSIRPSADSGMPLWQDKIFILLARNASDATNYFRIPTSRVVEVGTQVTV